MKSKCIVIVCMLIMGGLTAGSGHGESTLSFNFNNADLKTVLKAFSNTTGYTFVAPERLKGLVNVKIDELPPLKALDLIFSSQDYGYMLDKENIFVYDKDDTTFHHYTFKLQHIRVMDIKDLVTSVLAEDDSVGFSDTLNSVSVKGKMDTIRDVQRMIQALDFPPKQVLISAKILELKNGNGDTDQNAVRGVDLVYTDPSNEDTLVQTLSAGLAATEPSTGLYAQYLGEGISAYLTALDRVVGYELLASPWVTAVNHHPSSILIGSKIGYKTTIISETGTQENIEFLEVGIKLVFTPHISDDDFIRLTLLPSISDGQISNDLPQENTTETTSDVLVKDGQTIVIGGLTKTSETEVKTGIPVLSSLPFIGFLFGKVEFIEEKRDLMILITPTIITPEFLDDQLEESRVLESKLLGESSL